MANPPIRRRPPSDARAAAEAVFKPKAEAPAARPAEPAASSLPPSRELVSLHIDRDVLEHFQAGGPGWQARINAALRKAVASEK